MQAAELIYWGRNVVCWAIKLPLLDLGSISILLSAIMLVIADVLPVLSIVIFQDIVLPNRPFKEATRGSMVAWQSANVV